MALGIACSSSTSGGGSGGSSGGATAKGGAPGSGGCACEIGGKASGGTGTVGKGGSGGANAGGGASGSSGQGGSGGVNSTAGKSGSGGANTDGGAPGSGGKTGAGGTSGSIDGSAGGQCGPSADAEPFSKSIAGTWDFTPAGGAKRTLEVPGGGWMKQGVNAASGTYATQITVPDSGAAQTTLIEFGAVNFQATLSVDGKEVPGVKRTQMTIEQGGPPVFGEDNLPDPWSSQIIRRVQNGFSPVLVADKDYWEANKMSNTNGDWPSSVPALAKSATRPTTLLVFNDTFSGTSVDVTWEIHSDSPTGTKGDSGTLTVDVPLATMATKSVTITAPTSGTKFYLVLRAQKSGTTVFEETDESFTLQ